MKKFDFRILLGGGLLLLGGLLFLEEFDLLTGVAGWFWAAILFVGGAAFMSFFFKRPQGNWWAVIPAFALFGMAADTVLPGIWSGVVFLGALGLAFWAIYATDRSRWWAIIPGGILLTLATVSFFDDRLGGDASGGIFFIGLGITFLLVALLPNPTTDTRWAYIPAALLVLFGAFVGSSAAASLGNYIWPAALIAVGVGLIAGFFLKR
jgi:hypothetical protein